MNSKIPAALVASLLAAAAFARESIVFVGAHPDDTEGFAATAFLLKDKYDLHVVDLTRGELGLGWSGYRDGSTAKTRMAEETKACALLGATPHFLSEVDGFACAGEKPAEELAELFRTLKPRAVFSHWPVDRHIDHIQVWAVVGNALRRSGVWTERYFYEVLRTQTEHFTPLYSVDVSRTIADKARLLRTYACQNPNDEMALDKLDQAAQRGRERPTPVAAAEIFTTEDGEPIAGGVLEQLPETQRVADPDWLLAAMKAPRIFPVELPAEDAGNVWGKPKDAPATPDGVRPVFLEGEVYHGKSTRVFAWVGLPKGASAEARVPAMVLVHGGGGTAFAYWVKIWNDRGYAAIAMDTCGRIPQGERDGAPHPTHPWSGPTAGWDASVGHVDELPSDQWTHHAVAAVIRSHSHLRSLPEVDPTRIGLTGISWGGYLASIAGALDPRFRFAAPVYGCGFYAESPCWRKAMGRDPDAFARWCALWDPSVFLARAKGVPFLWIDGTNDRYYTLDNQRKSWAVLPKGVRQARTVKLRMPHAHPEFGGGTDNGDPRELAAYADACLKGGRPLVEITSAVCAEGGLRGTFDAHGRAGVRGELLYTRSDDPVPERRAWEVSSEVRVDAAAGTFSAKVPSGAVQFFVNLVDADGLVVSSDARGRKWANSNSECTGVSRFFDLRSASQSDK